MAQNSPLLHSISPELGVRGMLVLIESAIACLGAPLCYLLPLITLTILLPEEAAFLPYSQKASSYLQEKFFETPFVGIHF